MATKKCNKCLLDKPLEAFNKHPTTSDGRKGDCRECNSEYKRGNYLKNRDKIISKALSWANENKSRRVEYRKSYYLKNKELVDAKNRKYSEENRESVLANKKEYYEKTRDVISCKIKKYREINKPIIKARRKKYREDNKEIVREKKKLHRLKEISTPVGKLKENIRCGLRQYFKNSGHKKPGRTQEIIGCDYPTLHSHLYGSFVSRYGRGPTEGEEIHIDHIIPLKTASSLEEVIKLNHHSNLQWLLASDNLSKGAKINVDS